MKSEDDRASWVKRAQRGASEQSEVGEAVIILNRSVGAPPDF